MTVFSFTSVTSAKHHLAIRAAALEFLSGAPRLFGDILLGYFLDAVRVNLAIAVRGRNLDILGIPDL